MHRTGYGSAMMELLRSNDPVLISFAEALMKEAGIAYQVADQNMSVMEGTIGILPRRVLVERGRHGDARRILTEAGLGRELS
jgi:hypothetical protein